LKNTPKVRQMTNRMNPKKKKKMVVGNPATIIKDVSDEMIDWKTKGTALYQQLPAECYESLRAVEPLREIPENRPSQEAFYKTFEEFKKK